MMSTATLQAFPDAEGHPGMTLRDWFAGQFMAATITRSGVGIIETKAHEAYRAADAMLAERAKS